MIAPLERTVVGSEPRFCTLVEWRQGALYVRQVADFETMTVLSMQALGADAGVVELRLRRVEEGRWEVDPGLVPSPRKRAWSRVRHPETLARLEAGYRRFTATRLGPLPFAATPEARPPG